MLNSITSLYRPDASSTHPELWQPKYSLGAKIAQPLTLRTIGIYSAEIYTNVHQKDIYKNMHRDFSGGPVVKNPSCNAGDAGSIPGRGTRIPHATGQLSPRATTTELARHN